MYVRTASFNFDIKKFIHGINILLSKEQPSVELAVVNIVAEPKPSEKTAKLD